MKHFAIGSLAMAASVALASPASAAVFDFSGLTPYSVDGYTLTPLFGSLTTVGETLNAGSFSGAFSISSDDSSLFSISTYSFLPSAPSPTVDIFNASDVLQSHISGATPGTVPVFSAASSSFTFALYGYTPGTPLRLDNITIAAAAVPEPATWAMMVLGLAGIGMTLRQRRRQGDVTGSISPALV